MQSRRILITCLALLALTSAASAQEGPLPQQRRASLLVQQRWLKLMVLDGRLAVTAASDSQAAINMGNVRQHFAVNLTQNGAVLDYDMSSPAETLQVHIEGDDQATIRRQFMQAPDSKSDPHGRSFPTQVVVEYSQAPQQPVKLSLTEGGETRTVEAESLWHLLLFEPELSDRYLVPVLEMLRPIGNWCPLPTS